MSSEYQVIKYLDKKVDRYVALIEYKNKKAVLKKILSSKKKDLDKHYNEINFLSLINKM